VTQLFDAEALTGALCARRLVSGAWWLTVTEKLYLGIAASYPVWLTSESDALCSNEIAFDF
jgi:hypothetical protein